MAAGDASKRIRYPGKLCVNPTDFTTAFPHGGTALGLTDRCRLAPVTRTEGVLAEEYGLEETKRLFLGRQWRAFLYLRSHDADAFNQAFPSTFVGASTDRGIREPGAYGHGQDMLDRAAVFAYTPNDPTQGIGWVLYSAVIDLEATAEIQFRVASEGSFPVVIRGYRTSANRMIEIGHPGDFTAP